jgi:3-mercaptopyruvate sulfurtransferase SseA
MGAGILFIVAAVALLWGRTPGQPGGTTASIETLSPAGVPRVSLEEAKAAFDAGTAVFVDVRGADDYATGHIAGALSIPLSDIEAASAELDPGDWIITYCT